MSRQKTSKPIPKKTIKGPRRREQRKRFKERFKAFYDGTPDSDMDYEESEYEADNDVEFGRVDDE